MYVSNTQTLSKKLIKHTLDPLEQSFGLLPVYGVLSELLLVDLSQVDDLLDRPRGNETEHPDVPRLSQAVGSVLGLKGQVRHSCYFKTYKFGDSIKEDPRIFVTFTFFLFHVLVNTTKHFI